MVDPYKKSSVRKELDLRKELDQTFFGASDEIPKSRIGLLRLMRRNENNEAIRCQCRDRITDEPDKDTYCPHCLGHGFLWNEIRVDYYKNGEESSGDTIFYIQDNIPVTTIDYLVTLKLDNDGKVVSPAEREYHFKILDVIKFCSDNGRIEYVKLRTKLEYKWSVWYGVKLRGV